MSNKPTIGRIIREQRKKIGITLDRLSEISGVSLAHLSRIETGHRHPSPRTLQSIAKPLGFDLTELLVMAGHLSPDLSALSEEEREKLRDEMKMLSERVASDTKRMKDIVNRLLMS